MDGRDERLPLGLGRLSHLAGSIGNALLEGLDPDAFVSRIDVDRLVARVDPDGIVARTDIDALLERVDVDRLLERVDVNRLLDRVDIDRVLDRVDVDRFLDRVDVEGLVGRAGIPEIVAESTGHVAGSALDLIRQQAVALDVVVARGLVRLTGRDPDQLPAGPAALVGAETGQGEEAPAAAGPSRFEITGHYAGPLTRLVAYAGDIGLATGSFTAASAGLAYVLGAVFGLALPIEGARGPLWVAALVVWMFLYWWLTIAIAGRTPAMMVLGLRVLARDGTPLRPRRALVRTLVLPFSTLPFGLGFLGLILDRERRTLHDLAAGSTVVYDWGDRTVRLPTPVGSFISRHTATPPVG